MIDDITFSGIAPEAVGVVAPPGFCPGVAVPGRPAKLIAPRAGGAIVIEYTPSTQLVSVRLSVPRWLSQTRLVNYPLVPIRGVEDLRPRAIQAELVRAFGLQVSGIGDGYDETFPIRRWVVTRVSFAVDAPTSDPCKVITACQSLPRRWAGTSHAYGHPTQTLQWGEKKRSAYTATLYAKGIELTSKVRRERDPQKRLALQQLAQQAQNCVRFEVGFHRVRALRGFLNLGGTQLMTLAFMCDPLVGAWALTKEVNRLRLDLPYEVEPPGKFDVLVRHVVGVLQATRARLLAGQGQLGRRATMTKERMEKLLVTYFLLSGFSLNETAAVLEQSASALRDLNRDLLELGLVPDGNGGGLGASVAELYAGLVPHLLDDIPPNFGHWNARKAEAYAEVPWTDDYLEDELDNEQENDDWTEAIFRNPPGVITGSIDELYDAMVA